MASKLGLIALVCLASHLLPTASCQNTTEGSQPNEVDERQKPQKCFRAAVYEHNRYDSMSCEDSAETNLAIFRKVARTARENGANIIVFPEYGVFVGPLLNVKSCLEEVSEPFELNAKLAAGQNLCSLRGQAENKLPILSELSCIAEKNNIYLVANVGSIQKCEPLATVGELTCPKEGFLTFNTNVVFDSQGKFISRYRKYHLYGDFYNRAPKHELSYFDTPFGRFGQFICFDVLFKNPAIDLVETNKIDTILFPTNWFDNVPFLTAIQVQDFWSQRNNVNMLAANNLQPLMGTTGSGIYSIDNSSTYVSGTFGKPQLILQTLPTNSNNIEKCRAVSEPRILRVENVPAVPSRHLTYNPTEHIKTTKNDLVVKLDKAQDDVLICHRQVCCRVVYELAGRGVSDKLVLILRDGPRPKTGWYEQFCVLALSEEAYESGPVNSYSIGLSLKYEKLSFSGTFGTEYVFPTASKNVHQLVSRSAREFKCKQTEAGGTSCDHSLTRPEFVNSFGLYGRHFGAEMS